MWYPLEIVMTSSPDISVKVNQQKVVGSPILMQVICITVKSGSKMISPSLRCQFKLFVALLVLRLLSFHDNGNAVTTTGLSRYWEHNKHFSILN